jgi:ABC exporter DevB family membrane fusion protein
MEKSGLGSTSLTPKQWLIISFSLAIGMTTGVFTYHSLLLSKQATDLPPNVVEEKQPAIRSVTSLGRIEPVGKVIRLSATVPLEGARVAQLLVKEGEQVKAGQVIAILDSQLRQQANLKRAQEQVQIALAKLAQVKAGAKTGDIQAQQARFHQTQAELQGQITSQEAAIASLEAQVDGETSTQQATIRRLKAELHNAQTDCQRYQTLLDSGASSIQERDRNCLKAETSQESLNEAQANLQRIIRSQQQKIKEAQANLQRTIATIKQQITENQSTFTALAEVRLVDFQLAQAEVEDAKAAVRQVQADLSLTDVRAPVGGTILQVHTRPGETISSSGIVEIGQTQQMEVIAEVYKSDISQVRLGQKAIITSETFPNQLQGTVKEIGLQVKQQNIFSTEPGADVDRKIIEVKIRLNPEDSKRVMDLTHLQVQVAIQL